LIIGTALVVNACSPVDSPYHERITMRIMRIGAPGAQRPGVLLPDGRHLGLSGLADDIDGEFLAGDGPGRQLVGQA
jgi:hypothetical protein